MINDAMGSIKAAGKKLGKKFIEVNHKEHRKQMKNQWDNRLKKVLGKWERTEQFEELNIDYRVREIEPLREDTGLVDNSSKFHPIGDRMVWKSRYTFLEKPKDEVIRKSLKVLKRYVEAEDFGLVNESHYLSKMISKRYFVPQIVINGDNLWVIFTESKGKNEQSYTVYN